MSSKTDEELMNEYFATHSYNEQADWRKEPLTAVDPDDEQDTPKEPS